MRSGFVWAITASVSLHLILFASLTHINIKTPSPAKPTEITFIKVRNTKLNPRVSKRTHDIFKGYKIKDDLKKKLTPPQYVIKKPPSKQTAILDKPLFKKPSLDKFTFNQEKIMFIKPENTQNKSPAYMSYYEKIREEIRKNAYDYYEVSSGGKVFVNFTIDNQGNLVSLYLDKSRSQASAYLQDITIKSIKKSLPFPKFPSNLKKFKTLTFSLTVYFKSN